MFQDNVLKILEEIKFVLLPTKQSQIDKLIKEIKAAENIVVIGVGRMGLMAKTFSMRLGHFGLKAYTLGDSTAPFLHEKDLLIVCSGSGETQTVFDQVLIAQKNNVKIVSITGNPKSRIGKLSDVVVKINSPSKVKKIKRFKSIQPMTTLTEQSLLIMLDAIVLELMVELNQTGETMWARHFNLE